MSDAVPVRRADDGSVATLTIDRPQALNALNLRVLDALAEALASIASDPKIRCVIITGAGRSFVAGADIAQMANLSPMAARDFARKGHEVFAAIEALKVPVIAAVNGFCLGGGCELSLACDLVYASSKARFGQPEVKLGLIPGFGGTQRLARRIGPMRATELIVTGRMVKAEEALSIGLCLAVFEPDVLLTEVTRIAVAIAAQGPLAVQAAKRVQRLGVESPLASANAAEIDAFAVLFDTHDAREGMGAFVEKRDARFEGR